MIGYVMVGTNDLDKAISFYDEILKSINIKRVETDPEYAAYAPIEKPTAIEFYVTKPCDKEKPTVPTTCLHGSVGRAFGC